MINILLSTLPGVALPSTVSLNVPSDLTSHDLLNLIATFLPQNAVPKTFVATHDNRRIPCSEVITVSDLVQSLCRDGAASAVPFLSLRLNAPLVGGKGGFGSQLRAAGGRMSSRKRKQNAEMATGSARNLDGRRLRTITEAKNLATYLATKPEMDRKEKEERRKRWEQVIDLAEQREVDMRAGKTADGRRKGLSEEWIQEKEDIGDTVKNAVKLAMAVEDDSEAANRESNESDKSSSGSADEDSDGDDPMELDEEEMSRLRKEAEAGDADAIWVLHKKLKIPSTYLPKPRTQPRQFAGFDDDLSSSEDDDDVNSGTLTGKGKGVDRD